MPAMTVRSAPSSRFVRLFCLLLIAAVATTGCKSVGKMFKKDKPQP